MTLLLTLELDAGSLEAAVRLEDTDAGPLASGSTELAPILERLPPAIRDSALERLGASADAALEEREAALTDANAQAKAAKDAKDAALRARDAWAPMRPAQAPAEAPELVDRSAETGALGRYAASDPPPTLPRQPSTPRRPAMSDTKKALDAARTAGRAARDTPNADLPAEFAEDPARACPFGEGNPQRAAWLEGYLEADEESAVSSATIKAALADEVEVADKSGGTKR